MIKLEIREGRTDRNAMFTDADRLALLQIAQTPGWRVLLDLMETECLAQEATLVNADPADEKKVLAQHKIAKASWVFFVKLQQRVAFEISEIMKADATDMPAEDAEIASILDATQPPPNPPVREVDSKIQGETR